MARGRGRLNIPIDDEAQEQQDVGAGAGRGRGRGRGKGRGSAPPLSPPPPPRRSPPPPHHAPNTTTGTSIQAQNSSSGEADPSVGGDSCGPHINHKQIEIVKGRDFQRYSSVFCRATHCTREVGDAAIGVLAQQSHMIIEIHQHLRIRPTPPTDPPATDKTDIVSAHDPVSKDDVDTVGEIHLSDDQLIGDQSQNPLIFVLGYSKP
ncbi:hypothetical protein JCGZ_08687 [Jatropha curcas]|uniref:Uncharacterized protein n=1 Tax=Jatropha curcas TaxID=180498 RepID=A0A067KN37_JATCU|nr:hypothetical protein JCGZ_08687 [Jatropha curcas]